MFISNITVSVFILCFFLDSINCQDTAMEDFFKKASKSVPRIGRSNSKSSKGSNDDFENFFLKASKSVPRIGRRDRGAFDLDSSKKWIEIPKLDSFTLKGEPLQPSIREEPGDKIKSENRFFPLSEISKYRGQLDAEELENAYIHALQASRMKEMD